jgi:hypothetical protein
MRAEGNNFAAGPETIGKIVREHRKRPTNPTQALSGFGRAKRGQR